MESTENAFVESQKKKKRKKRIRNIVILCVVAVLLVAGCLLLFARLNAAPAEVSVLRYNAESVREGEISSTISGSGTLTATEGDSYTSVAAATVEEVFFAPGDKITAGDAILTLASDELEAQLDERTEELDAVQAELADTTRARTNLNITAPKKGVVKAVRAQVGDVAEELDYLCLIATDGRMKLVIDAPEGMKKYDAVLVSVAGAETVEGRVTELTDGKASITFADGGYAVGESAEAYSEEHTPLGSGTLTVSEYVAVRGEAGRITGVKNGAENTRVAKGAVLFTLEKGAPTSEYVELKEQEAALIEQIEDIESQLTIRADYDCMLSALSVKAGDEVAAGAALCTLSGSGGYTMALSIDELDISSVALGQDATVTLDALEGEFTGRVTDISYAGSGSYVTSYTVTVTTEPIEGALPGMSASVAIVTETSGNSLIVSVGALQYEDEQAYVWLCADGVQRGASASETELDTGALEKVYVQTGMSDGSYIAVTGEGLAAGCLIWAPALSTTAQYVEEDTTASFSFGAQGGGMPSGGMPGGGYDGERPTRPDGGFPGGN